MHAGDQREGLAHDLDRVDLAQGGAVVAVVDLAQLQPELLLLGGVEAHPEVAQPPRQLIDVLVDGVDQQPREAAHVGGRERAGDAEVDDPQPAVLHHEQVGRMRVGVEGAVAEHHLQPYLRHQVRQPAALGRIQRRKIGVAERGALDPLQRQHPLAGERPVDLGDHDGGRLGEHAPEHLGVPGLDPVVELARDGAGELVHQLHRVHELEALDAALHDLADLAQQRDVGLDLTAGVGTLHLHGHRAAGVQLGQVHLADRGGRHRHRVEGGEQVADLAVQLLADHLLHLLVGEGRDRVLQQAQLADDLGRHQVGADREQLAELDEGRAQLVQHLAQVPAARLQRHLRLVPRAPRPPLERIPEAVPGGHLGDLTNAGDLGAPRGLRLHEAMVPPEWPRPAGRQAAEIGRPTTRTSSSAGSSSR